MEQEFVNWFNSAPSNGVSSLVLLGMFTMLFLNLSTSLIDYLTAKSWEVYDLKKFIARHFSYYDCDYYDDRKLLDECCIYYNNYLKSKEKIDKFKNKIKSLFHRK